MKKRYAILFLACSIAVIHAHDLDFVLTNFQKITELFAIQLDDQKRVADEYLALNKKIGEMPINQLRDTLGYLRKLALNSMKTKNPEWYGAIMPYVSDPYYTLDPSYDKVRKENIGKFLARYGSCCEFTEHNTLNQVVRHAVTRDQQKPGWAIGSIWDGVKGAVSTVSNKVSGWFFKSSGTTTEQST